MIKEPSELLQRYFALFPDDGYLRYHAPRFKILLSLIERECRGNNRNILDIGKSVFTNLLSEFLNTSVDTLGFERDGETETGEHYHFDLNDCQHLDKWRKGLRRYDLVVFAEVIEHLHVSPKLVLGFINSITAEKGLVILQTPNAAALFNRLKLLVGRNPYEKIREEFRNPGHFREYTKDEIINYVRKTGFVIKQFFYGNYFDLNYVNHSENYLIRSNKQGLMRDLYRLLPGSFKPGMTFVLQKDSSVTL